jgi:hypothetical protein
MLTYSHLCPHVWEQASHDNGQDIFIYTYIYIYNTYNMYIQTHTHTHTHTHVYIYTHIYIYVYIRWSMFGSKEVEQKVKEEEIAYADVF